MEEFEKWLRTVCFQKPTPEAYDLAKGAWMEGRNTRPSPDLTKGMLWKGKCDKCDGFGRLKSGDICQVCKCKVITRPATLEEAIEQAKSSIEVNKVSHIPCYLKNGGTLSIKEGE